ERMDQVVGLLHSMVVYNYQRLKGLVAGLTQEEIDYQGNNHEFNSIAQLLRHLAVVDLHWVYRINGVPIPDQLREHYGPMYNEDGKLPQVKNVPLELLLEEYDYVQHLFREACLQLSDEDLVRTVSFGN